MNEGRPGGKSIALDKPMQNSGRMLNVGQLLDHSPHPGQTRYAGSCGGSALITLPVDGEVIAVDDVRATPAAESLACIGGALLRVLSNGRRPGGPFSRNLCFAQAKGGVLFFPDDDDKMLPDYCRYVLEQALPSDARPVYGFSSIESCGGAGVPRVTRKNISGSVVPVRTPFKTMTFPFSIGLWVTRETYDHVGPIDETMPTNTFTNYSCRLAAAGKRLSYSAEPGVQIYMHGDQQGQLGQVIKRISSAKRSNVFLTLIKRHASYLTGDRSARDFLFKRHLKLAAKANQAPLDLRRVEGGSLAERLKFLVYHHVARAACSVCGAKRAM